MKRRTFLTALTSIASLGTISIWGAANAKSETKHTLYQDNGAKGKSFPALEDAPFSESTHTPANLSHWELQGIKATMKNYLDVTDIRWGIPAKNGAEQGVLLFNSIVVTWKPSPLRHNTVYIEVERV